MGSVFKFTGNPQTAKYESRGLDYFLALPKLQAQVQAAALKKVNESEMNLSGVIDKDREILGKMDAKFGESRNYYTDKALSGENFNNSDTKGIVDLYNNVKEANKLKQEASISAAKISKDKSIWNNLRLSKPEMIPYIDRMEKNSMDGYEGIVGEDGSVNSYETDQGPGYVDVYGEAARLFGLASKNFTQEQWSNYNPRIEPVEFEKDDGTTGIMRKFVVDNPDKFKSNFKAMDKAALAFTDFMNSNKVREFFDYVGNDNYENFVSTRVNSLPEVLRQQNIIDGGQSFSAVPAGLFKTDTPNASNAPIYGVGNYSDNIYNQRELKNKGAVYSNSPDEIAYEVDGQNVKLPRLTGADYGAIGKRKRGVIKKIKEGATPVVLDYDKYARTTRNFYLSAFEKENVSVEELDKFIYESVDTSGKKYDDIMSLNPSLRASMSYRDITKLQENLSVLQKEDITELQVTEGDIISGNTEIQNAKNSINKILNSSFSKMNKGLRTTFSEAPIVTKNEAARKKLNRDIGGELHNKEFLIINDDGSITEGSGASKDNPLSGKAGQDKLINLLNSESLEGTDFKIQSVKVAGPDFKVTDIPSKLYDNMSHSEKAKFNNKFDQPIIMDVYNKETKKSQRVLVQSNNPTLKSLEYSVPVDTPQGAVPYRILRANLIDPNDSVTLRLSDDSITTIEKISDNKYLIKGDKGEMLPLNKSEFKQWEREMLYNQINTPLQ